MEVINIKKTYVFFLMTCLFEFYLGMIGPIFVLYLYQIGFDAFKCNLLLATSLISQFVCEIPCGILSDYLGRKNIVILGGITLAISNLLFIISESFEIILLAQIISGISFAMYSGSLDSWISENIKKENIKKIFVKKNKYLSIMMILTGLCGSVIADINIKIVFASCIISELLFIYFAYKYIKNINIRNQIILNSRSIFYSSIHYIKNNKEIMNVFIYNFILIISISPIFVYWSPLLSQYSTKTTMTFAGVIWIFMRLGLLLGNNIVQLLKKDSFQQLLIITFLCACILLIITTNNIIYLYIIALIVFEIVLGMINALKEARINYVIENNRATLLSMNSFFVTIGNYFSIFVYGIIANMTSIKFCIFLGGILLLCYSILTYFSVNSKSII